MEFSVFAKKLKNIIGGKSNTKVFTKTIFETMMNQSGAELLKDTSPETFKAYYNGHTKISKIAPLILANLSDEDEFSSYLDSFGETTAQLLADEFKNDILDIHAANASTKITDLFLEILMEASGKEKSTPKSAENSSYRISVDELSRNNHVSPTSMQLPELYSDADAPPYSLKDNLLLQEFTTDYDEIMMTFIGEDYAASLIDNTMLYKIKDLYESKWLLKANKFLEPTLKSHIFSLLGELNNISNCILTNDSHTPFLKRSRAKIRNLYVKLHPKQFSCVLPYDAFIDDWNDGEF